MVLVHDGVRPLVPAGLVTALVSAAAADGAAGLTRPLVSTVLETPPGHHGRLERSLDRSRHRASETPQAFSYSVIRRAYQQVPGVPMLTGTCCRISTEGRQRPFVPDCYKCRPPLPCKGKTDYVDFDRFFVFGIVRFVFAMPVCSYNRYFQNQYILKNILKIRFLKLLRY